MFLSLSNLFGHKFCSPPRMIVFLLIGLFATPGNAQAAQQAGGVQAAGPKIRLVRSMAGSKGEQRAGTYAIADPRTVFYVPEDREVIVYFEWEGPKGRHHCEGTVKGPNGQLAIMSSFDYIAAQPRFGGYWKVPLSEDATPGAWTFESRVDGESAGDLTFEIVAAKRPADTTKQDAPATTAEIYQKAVAASVFIDKLDAKGQPFATGSGFFLLDGMLLTSFHVINGAHALRIRFPDGRQLQTDRIAAWNRRQDWAILNLGEDKTPSLKRADPKSWNIGDHCYWLDAKSESGRVIADGQIVGHETPEGWGERLSISGLFNLPAVGGPLMNEQGEVLGFLGGALPASLLNGLPQEVQGDGSGGAMFSVAGTAVPISLVAHNPTASPKPLQELWDTGQMVPLVTASRNVMFGMLSRGGTQGRKGPADREMKFNFTRQDQAATVILAFQAPDSLKSSIELRVYDIDGQTIASSNPLKLNLRRGETIEHDWQISLTRLPPGYYRVDVLLGQEVAWRHYFQLRE